MGTLYGVGVGPGDAENMTYKAVRIIRQCDVIVLPASSRDTCIAYGIAKEQIPDIDRKEIRCCPFPMTSDRDAAEQAHRKIAEDITDILAKGQDIAFLTIGDPSLYSTYGYIHELVDRAGFPVQIISGIPSFCAVAARLGMPLAMGREQIRIIPGAVSDDEAETLVYLKAGMFRQELSRLMEISQNNTDTLICGVSDCGLADETLYHNASDLRKADHIPYLTTIIVKHTS